MAKKPKIEFLEHVHRAKLEARVPVTMLDLVDDLRMSCGLTRTAFLSIALAHFCAELAATFPAPKRHDALSKLEKMFKATLTRSQNAV
jgi:hypothetical protein